MADSPQIRSASPTRRTMVFAALCGFVLGSGLLGLLWGLSAAADDAAADARAACSALRRVGDLPGAEPGGVTYVQAASLPNGTIERLAAARSLAMAAATGSATYRDLADHIDGVHSMVMSLNFADAAGRKHLVEAERICGHV